MDHRDQIDIAQMFKALKDRAPIARNDVQTLSKSDRALLLNLIKILDKFDSNPNISKLMKILEHGYVDEYWQIFEMLRDEMRVEDTTFVKNVLSMFGALQRPYIEAGASVPFELRFPGFDEYSEDSLLGYARFLIEDEDRWPQLKLATPSDLNSRLPVSDVYRRMLDVWQTAGSPPSVSGQLAADILAALVHPDHRK